MRRAAQHQATPPDGGLGWRAAALAQRPMQRAAGRVQVAQDAAAHPDEAVAEAVGVGAQLLDLGGWSACIIGWALFNAWFLYSCRSSLQQQHQKMRAKLSRLTAQHGKEVDVVEGVHWPGGQRTIPEFEKKARGSKGAPTPSRFPKSGTAKKNGTNSSLPTQPKAMV